MTVSPQTHADMQRELRGVIGELTWYMAVQCGIAQDYAAIGDDAGLAYSLQRIVAYAKESARCFNQIRQNQLAQEFAADDQIGGA